MASLLFLTGCSLDASIEAINETVTKVLSKASTTEVTPGSTQNSYSTRGFKIQASVSNQDASSEGVTPRGYKVNTNVQGTIFKE